MNRTKLIISDLDGTLVDSFQANYHAYKKVLQQFDVNLDKEFYRKNYGMRMDDFIQLLAPKLHTPSTLEKIKNLKSEIYPNYFKYLILNTELVEFIKLSRQNNIKTAIASTANSVNVKNVLKHFKLTNLFDLVVAGNDIKNGKPAPDCFIKCMNFFGTKPNETLIFEDSKVGIEAAIASKGNYFVVEL